MSTTLTALSEYVFYKGSESGASSRIGWDSGEIRFIRYKFTAPTEGANGVSISKTNIGLAEGSALDLRFIVSTNPDLYAELPTDYGTLGWEMSKAYSGGYYTFTGSTDEVILLPNTEYYLYIFPSSYVAGSMYSWNYASTITVTLDGAAGLIRIREGDEELITIPLVKNGDGFIQLAAAIKSGSSLILCG